MTRLANLIKKSVEGLYVTLQHVNEMLCSTICTYFSTLDCYTHRTRTMIVCSTRPNTSVMYTYPPTYLPIPICSQYGLNGCLDRHRVSHRVIELSVYKHVRFHAIHSHSIFDWNTEEDETTSALFSYSLSLSLHSH
jgi:hypothetical protein